MPRNVCLFGAENLQENYVPHPDIAHPKHGNPPATPTMKGILTPPNHQEIKLAGAQPPTNCSFALHLVGNMAILCSFAHH